MPTEEEINSRRTARGGWQKVDLAKWGVPWPPPKGWRQAIIAGHGKYYEGGRMHVNQAFQLSMAKYGPKQRRRV